MKNWEVEAILKFYKDIDLDIKVTGEWLEQYESVYDTTGAINYGSACNQNSRYRYRRKN